MSPARIRVLALALPIVTSAVAFLAWSQTWVVVRLTDGRMLSVAGDIAAPALPPLAIAALALVGALGLAGVVFRVILALLQALLGAGIAASGAVALGDPAQSVAATVTEATGVEGIASVRGVVDTLEITPWPWVAIVAGALAIMIGIAIAVTAPRWPQRTRRFDAVRTEPAGGPVRDDVGAERTDPLDAWDALSDGDDPTSR